MNFRKEYNNFLRKASLYYLTCSEFTPFIISINQLCLSFTIDDNQQQPTGAWVAPGICLYFDHESREIYNQAGTDTNPTHLSICIPVCGEYDKSEGFRSEDGVAMFVLLHSRHCDVWRLVVEVVEGVLSW